ncbi:MAG: KPN_02809 family neutral zinc metallopeptidase, partial [Planctomycetota bacterium]
ILVIVLLVALMGGDPSSIPLPPAGGGAGGPPGGGTSSGPPPTPEEDELAAFVSVVLADTEDVWNEIFRAKGNTYEEPKLVLFRGHVDSACGFASSAVGPFYCPPDKKVFIDLSFYDQLQRRFGAPGDFAQAYVIAHEVGHHIQNLLGISTKVHEMQQRLSQADANELSVRLELQADFLAGVWAHHAQRTKNILERGDIEEALRAASAIGDDNIQRQTQGHVVPDSFTHGTSAQRVAWFRHGFETGLLSEGDTFDEAHFQRIDPR